MRVRLIKLQTINDYVSNHSKSEKGFVSWLSLLKYADWEYPQDIIKTYKSADILGNGSDRVVFNINGNKYRMICKYTFGRKSVMLFVCWVGTHAAYTKLCKNRLQYTVQDY